MRKSRRKVRQEQQLNQVMDYTISELMLFQATLTKPALRHEFAAWLIKHRANKIK